jgi:hypothetical protein
MEPSPEDLAASREEDEPKSNWSSEIGYLRSDDLPIHVVWIHGDSPGMTCFHANIPYRKVSIGTKKVRKLIYPTFDGIAIDVEDKAKYEAASGERSLKRQCREEKKDLRYERFQDECKRLKNSMCLVRATWNEIAEHRRVELDVTDCVGNCEVQRKISKFISEDQRMDYYAELMGRLSKNEIRDIAKTSGIILHVHLKKHDMASRVVLAIPLELTPDDVLSCKRETAMVTRLASTNTLLNLNLNMKLDGLPPIVRAAIRSHVVDGVPLKLAFIQDRLQRAHEIKRSMCDFKHGCHFVNTPHTWYREDPFSTLPVVICVYLLSFISDSLEDGACIGASRELAEAIIRMGPTECADVKYRMHHVTKTKCHQITECHKHSCNLTPRCSVYDCNQIRSIRCPMGACGSCCCISDMCSHHTNKKRKRN